MSKAFLIVIVIQQSFSLKPDETDKLRQSCFAVSCFVSIVTQSQMDMLIHHIVSSHMAYCDSLLTCLNKSSLNHLQLVRWLSIRLRIPLKFLLLIHRTFHGQASVYISDLLIPTLAVGHWCPENKVCWLSFAVNLKQKAPGLLKLWNPHVGMLFHWT